MKAILFILMITDTANFETNGEISYNLVMKQADVEWEQCALIAHEINDGSRIEVGKVTATCFPYTLEEGKIYNNERSGQHS